MTVRTVAAIFRGISKHTLTNVANSTPNTGLNNRRPVSWCHNQPAAWVATYANDNMTTFDCPVGSCDRSVQTERGLKSHIAQVHPDKNAWNSEAWLREQYVEKEKSLETIADEHGCSAATLSRKLEQFGIEPRSRGHAHRVPYIPYTMGPYGRMRWRSTRGDGGEKVSYGFEVHRLLAIAEYGVDAVAGNDVHHKNQIPWDNRPENIEVLSKEEHGKLHSDKYYNND